jgi:DNA invertase Pin-like site-specific DNA recombinase
MATKNKAPKAPKTETAVIYCRVSSWKQTDGISLPNQEKQCREACEKKGLKVLSVFADAYSGRTVTRE